MWCTLCLSGVGLADPVVFPVGHVEHVGQLVHPRDQVCTLVTHLCCGCLSHFQATFLLDPVVSCPTVSSVHPSRLLCRALGSNMARHRLCVSASASRIRGFLLFPEHVGQLVRP